MGLPKPPKANHDTTSNNRGNQPIWLLDNGASHHITYDTNRVNLRESYEGLDIIVIGCGVGIKITHTRNSFIFASSTSFLLHDVLCAPKMQQI